MKRMHDLMANSIKLIYAMHVGFLEAGVCDLYQLHPLPELFEVECSRITHPTLDAVGETLHHIFKWTCEWNVSLHSLRTKGLRVQVFSTCSLLLRHVGSHSINGYVRPAIPLNILMNFPSLLKATPGLYSQPATKRPTITESAPMASALHMLPEFLLPPSEHRGISQQEQIGAVSIKADS